MNTEEVLAGCGHMTRIQGTIRITEDGIEQDVEMTLLTEDGVPAHCFDCLQKAIIPCAHCGNSILPGEPITLHLWSTSKKTLTGTVYNLPRDLTKDDKFGLFKYMLSPKKKEVVGCSRHDCCIGADIAGYWVMPGTVSLMDWEQAVRN